LLKQREGAEATAINSFIAPHYNSLKLLVIGFAAAMLARIL
jgi:hypothetical protein